MSELICYDFFPSEFLSTPPLVFHKQTKDKEFLSFIHSGAFACAVTNEAENLEWHHIPYLSKGNAASEYYGILLAKRLHIPFAHKIGIQAFKEFLDEKGINLTVLHNQYMSAYIIYLKERRQ